MERAPFMVPWVCASALWLCISALLCSLALSQPEQPGDVLNGPGALLDDDFMHVGYHFSLARRDMRRQGKGELWLSLADGIPRMRLRGSAHSGRFGQGNITIVVDSSSKVVYVLLALGELHERQCVTYPFPQLQTNAKRMKMLEWRRDQVMEWQERQRLGKAPTNLLTVNWTKSYTLEFLLRDDGRTVQGVDLRQGNRFVKTVRIEQYAEAEKWGDLSSNNPQTYAVPSAGCRLASDVADPLVRVEFRPPHHKSSALRDLLLVMAAAQQDSKSWPPLFVMLSTIIVPGDIAVMIEDPEPPDLVSLGGLAFDYTTTIYSLGGNLSFNDPANDIRKHGKHSSDGSIWLNLKERTFHLHDEQQETKLGPVIMDLVAHTGQHPMLYANVKLPAQEERQCVAYDFPPLPSLKRLQLSAEHPLSFAGIDEIRGEDCGIFAAPITHGKQIYIWVDMEGENPGAFLRAEVRKGNSELRSIDVLHWHSADVVPVAAAPGPEWNCSSEFDGQHFVHLGLKELHGWSLELRDSLSSLRVMPRTFVILQILGLAGDVNLMVKEPEAPTLWRLPALSFSYTMFLGPGHGDFAKHQGRLTVGNFAADLDQGKFRVSISDGTTDGINISVALEQDVLAVNILEAPSKGGKRHCLALPLAKNPDEAEQPLPAAGIFDGVERIGQEECNRFTFLGAGTHDESSVRFWLSKTHSVDGEGDRVCQLRVLPPMGGDTSALLYVKHWESAYVPKNGGSTPGEWWDEATPPAEWGCVPVSEVRVPWIELVPLDPRDRDKQVRLSWPGLSPATIALSKLVEAADVVGLLPPWAANALSQLVIRNPSGSEQSHDVATVTRPPAPSQLTPVDIFSTDLHSFSFRFESTYTNSLGAASGRAVVGGAAPGVGHRGSGELRVDLNKRQLYLRSEATNISSGMSKVQSEVIFNGDRGRLYAYTRFPAENYHQCWSVAVAANSTPGRNPFLKSRPRIAPSGSNVEPGDIWYTARIDEWRRIDFVVNGGKALSAIHVVNIRSEGSASATVHDWSTQPIDHGWFEPADDWECEEELKFLDNNESMVGSWDLLRFIFEGDTAAPYRAQEPRQTPRRELLPQELV